MSVASKAANANSGFKLLPNPTNPSAEEVATALKLVRSGGITHPQTATPDRSLTIPSISTSDQRDVRIAIYDPPSLSAETKRPVVLSWHGSGFVVDRFGADADVNRWLVDELNVTVVDGDYAKAPEGPFPEGLFDAVSALKWTVRQPWFDGNLVLKGHSAGANFALCLSSRTTARALGVTDEEYDTIKACVTLYPPTDSSIPLEQKKTNENGEEPGIPMSALSAQVMHFFFGAYLGWDPKYQQEMGLDPRVSPAKAEIESYEVPCYIIACQHDPLLEEAQTFAQRLGEKDSRHEFYLAQGVGHNYETRIPDVRDAKVLDAPGGKAKVESFARLLEFIRKNVPAVNKQ
ncbi:Alpha/beta hydrolase fold-3 [Kalmanozyma brasiliensis GHG001]|uniref:Alpha/beta hydrolase fold-3 domain-containing protein n=1 Tax=Kalmanozyma brasiliensis (strain GHG001) TaxID=1365824 RepID=V5GRE3_KALBG|nr:Alpha/beta hydrolase fold-3 [Kalmanozyma brasiliensis GHG001]EST08512.1 Alpha/beta hydrolase fold-3 [Kalmanozyma brasiliensis GHG001]